MGPQSVWQQDFAIFTRVLLGPSWGESTTDTDAHPNLADRRRGHMPGEAGWAVALLLSPSCVINHVPIVRATTRIGCAMRGLRSSICLPDVFPGLADAETTRPPPQIGREFDLSVDETDAFTGG